MVRGSNSGLIFGVHGTLLLSILCLGGCALIATGFNQNVEIVTNVPGSKVYVNGNLVDSTPCAVKVRRSLRNNTIIEVKKDSFESQSFELKKKFNEHAALNFILPWNWAIDLLSGAVVRYEQPDTIVLTPRKKTP